MNTAQKVSQSYRTYIGNQSGKCLGDLFLSRMLTNNPELKNIFNIVTKPMENNKMH
jgi:hemoglobin-like flavoprotein